jgi:hypothetical protein
MTIARCCPSPLALAVATLLPLLATPDAGAQSVREDFWVPNGTVNAAVVSGTTLYVGGDFSYVGPPTGGGVPVDAATGAPLSGFPQVDGCVYAAASDDAGGWYIGGSFTSVAGLPRTNAAHVLSDMSVAAWDPQPNSLVMAIAVNGSTVYLGGFFTAVAGQNRQLVAAVDAGSGALISGFDAQATRVGFDSVRAILVGNGLLYVGGQFTSMGGQSRTSAAALDASTGTATSWDGQLTGGIPYTTVLSMAASSTTLYLCGNFFGAGGAPRAYIAAFDLNTGNATSWDAQSDDEPLALALSPGGNLLYAGGQFTHIGGADRQRMAALDATTALATAWDPGADDVVSAIVLSGTSVYAGGSFTTLGGAARGHVGAVDTGTGLATAWNPGTDDWVGALAVNGSGVYVGGSYRCLGGVARRNLAAFDLTSGAATAWNPDPDGMVLSLALQGSTLYAGGWFANVGAASRPYVAALDLASGAATAWNPGTDGPVEALAADDTVVYLGGSFSHAGGLARSYVAQIDAATGLTRTQWDATADGPVHAMALNATRLFVGGGFVNIGGLPRNHIAALHLTDGTASTVWNPDADSDVYAILLSGTTVFVGGQFGNIGGQARSHLASLSISSGLARTFDPNSDGVVRALAQSGSTIYAGGDFTSVGGDVHACVAAVDATSGVVSVWDPTLGAAPCPNADPAQVNAVVVDGIDILAGGSFSDLRGRPRGHLAAIGDISTPAQLALVSVDVTPDHVRLMWYTPAGASFFATLYRRTAGADWTSLGQVSADGNGQVTYDDHAVSAGTRYDYRLGVLGAGTETFYGETSVTIPAAVMDLALAGPRPNPGSHDLTVELSLPDGAPAMLELLDVAGRRVLAREVGGLGAGRHVLTLASGRRLGPGVYLLRLTHGGRSLTARAVIVG